MISSKEYEVLALIINKAKFKYKDYINELTALRSKGYIVPANDEYINIRSIKVTWYELTPSGRSAYEEYDRFLREQEIKERTLFLSKQSNKIAKCSNALSIIAIIVTVLGVVASVLIGLYA